MSKQQTQILEKHLDPVVAEEAYNWLDAWHPHYVPMLEIVVAQGVEPRNIARYMRMKYGQHWEKVTDYLELAAMHIKRRLEDG